MRLLAFAAQALGQTLRENTQQRISEVERIHAHVKQAHDGFRRAIGMQRGKHQVPRERRLNAR